MSELHGRQLFDAICRATGPDRLVAPFTVRRLLMRVRVLGVEHVTIADLSRALPHFRTELGKYLHDDADYARYRRAGAARRWRPSAFNATVSVRRS